MWESPVYKFKIPKDDNSDSSNLEEIVIDVTRSAPPFNEPSPALKQVLLKIFSEFPSMQTVLEFGAGKLKNVPFILQQGKIVCAVEFEQLKRAPLTQKILLDCEIYGNRFQQLIFPCPFMTDTKKFDLALLINVPPVMPVVAERLFLLDLLYNKINPGGHLLWLAMKEGTNYKKRRESGKYLCGDGIWMGKGREIKTFYKYHRVDELDEIMGLYGFQFVEKFKVADDARLYEKIDYNLFSGALTPERISQNIPTAISTEILPIVPNPASLAIETLYQEKIHEIIAGRVEYAELYHRIISYALARIFRGALRNMAIKVEVNRGRRVIDTVFTNSAESGFFYNLRSKVDCAYPIVEAKNISGDPEGSEFDQLNAYLNEIRGRFGILVCRHVINEEAAYERCGSYLPSNYVLFLTDEDIFELLDYEHGKNEDEINDFMDTKLRRLLFYTPH